MLAFVKSVIAGAISTLSNSGIGSSVTNSSSLSLLRSISTALLDPLSSWKTVSLLPCAKYPSTSGFNSSPFTTLSVIAAIVGSAALIPVAASFVGTTYALALVTSRPGFSSYIPDTTGIPFPLKNSATPAQAIPYLPALNAGPAITTSGLCSSYIFSKNAIASSLFSLK